MQSYNSRRAGGYLDERIGEDRKDMGRSKECIESNNITVALAALLYACVCTKTTIGPNKSGEKN